MGIVTRENPIRRATCYPAGAGFDWIVEIRPDPDSRIGYPSIPNNYNNNNNNIHICIAPYGRNFRGAGPQGPRKRPRRSLIGLQRTYINPFLYVLTAYRIELHCGDRHFYFIAVCCSSSMGYDML